MNEKLKSAVQRVKDEMTEKRFNEIEKALKNAHLSETEILAWLEIHREFGKWGGDHKFANQTTS